MNGRVIYPLTFVAAALSLGHHVDHVLRGNHVGWPLNDQVNAFTVSLGIYPTLAIALLAYRSGRIGPGAWALLSGNGALFVALLHFGPYAVEPPHDIIDRYRQPWGLFWFGWLVTLVVMLGLTCAVETRISLRKLRRDTTAGATTTATEPVVD